jgi:hypothetical protein
MLRSFRHRVDRAQYHDLLPDHWETSPHRSNHGKDQIRVTGGDQNTAEISSLLKAPPLGAQAGVGTK